VHTLNRRDFLKGVGAGTIAAGSGVRLAFGSPDATQNILVVVFQRGACDGLSLLPPAAGSVDRAKYEENRATAANGGTRIPTSGTGALLALPNTGNRWGLHPRANGLFNLYQSGHLAPIVAAGMPAPVTRSHFDAQKTMELGTPGQQSVGAGWLTRYLQSAALPNTVPVPALSMGSITANSLLSSTDAITVGSAGAYRLDSGAYGWNSADNYANNTAPTGFQGLVEKMPLLWQGSDTLSAAGRQTLDALAQLRPIDFNFYDPTNHPLGYTPSGGANYTTSGQFGQQLANIAQTVKSNLGLTVATVDLGSWDTHQAQGNPANTYDTFGNMVQTLSDGLSAFYTDLSAGATNYMLRVTVIVMTEFGRRVRENSSGGTDHGYGSVMWALGASVNGGQAFGNFIGLDQSQLFEYADVQVTTDYRRVLSEALIRRQANPHVYYVFPGYGGYTPMGIFGGSDLPPDNFDSIFANGFN
jgi:uncharacterized protein (DUF1501 family)